MPQTRPALRASKPTATRLPSTWTATRLNRVRRVLCYGVRCAGLNWTVLPSAGRDGGMVWIFANTVGRPIVSSQAVVALSTVRAARRFVESFAGER